MAIKLTLEGVSAGYGAVRALHGVSLELEQGRTVALLGTFSKTVSQALSAGFLLVPENLRRVIEPARHDLGGPVSAVVQAALAEYLASGELRRHTARMRRRYAARRELVV